MILIYALARSIHLRYTMTMNNQWQAHGPDIDRFLEKKRKGGLGQGQPPTFLFRVPSHDHSSVKGIPEASAKTFGRQHSGMFDGLGERRNMLSAAAVCGWHDLRLGPRSSPSSSSPAAVRRPFPSPRNCGCHSASHRRHLFPGRHPHRSSSLAAVNLTGRRAPALPQRPPTSQESVDGALPSQEAVRRWVS